MSTYFKQKQSNFTMVSNFALKDTNLSRKAKGLYAEIYAYITIPDFKLSKSYLIKQGLEGESAFNSMWNELKDKGYLKQYRVRTEESNNGFSYEYELLDKPDLTTPYLINIKMDGSEGAKSITPEERKNPENHRGAKLKNAEKSGNQKNKTPDFVPPRFSTVYESHAIQNIGDNNNTDLNNTDLNNTEFLKERVKEKETVDYQGVIDLYNETCVSLPSVQKLTDKRKRALKARLKNYSVEDLKTVFEKAEESPFLNGSSGKWSGATFDWLIKEDNIVKVLEGNYDDKVSSRKASYDLDAYEKENNLKEIINDFNDLNDKGSKRKGLFTIEAMEVE